jgi:hypothetical protein
MKHVPHRSSLFEPVDMSIPTAIRHIRRYGELQASLGVKHPNQPDESSLEKMEMGQRLDTVEAMFLLSPGAYYTAWWQGYRKYFADNPELPF